VLAPRLCQDVHKTSLLREQFQCGWMASSKPGILTFEQTLTLQRELYAAFADDEFQEKLEELEARHGKAYKNYTSEHTKLFLTVQDRILPTYGFPEGQRGVVQMLDDASRFNDNPTFQRNRLELNRLIGLAPTSEEETELQAEAEARGLRGPATGPAAGPLAGDAAWLAERPALGTELVAPAITELLRWRTGERRGLKMEAGSRAAGPANESAGWVGALQHGGRAGDTGEPRGASVGNAVAEDIGSWIRSIDGDSLAVYEPFLRRLVDRPSQIKDAYPHLQDFFAAVPIHEPKHRQLFARAIRALSEPA